MQDTWHVNLSDNQFNGEQSDWVTIDHMSRLHVILQALWLNNKYWCSVMRGTLVDYMLVLVDRNHGLVSTWCIEVLDAFRIIICGVWFMCYHWGVIYVLSVTCRLWVAQSCADEWLHVTFYDCLDSRILL